MKKASEVPASPGTDPVVSNISMKMICFQKAEG